MGITHGHTRALQHSPEYQSWHAMIQRCTNPKHRNYSNYGGAGIKVCKRWRDFANFFSDMGKRPAGTTLDRKDGAKGYEHGNCRWATPKEQAANRRKVFNRHAGKTHCPEGHPYQGKNVRIAANGWRKCRECERLRAQAARDRRKAAARPLP